MMEYRPSPSVIAERVFSMSASLAASTVTPGRIAPEVSLTTPAIVLWADATVGKSANSAAAPRARIATFMLIFDVTGALLTGSETLPGNRRAGDVTRGAAGCQLAKRESERIS